MTTVSAIMHACLQQTVVISFVTPWHDKELGRGLQERWWDYSATDSETGTACTMILPGLQRNLLVLIR